MKKVVNILIGMLGIVVATGGLVLAFMGTDYEHFPQIPRFSCPLGVFVFCFGWCIIMLAVEISEERKKSTEKELSF